MDASNLPQQIQLQDRIRVLRLKIKSCDSALDKLDSDEEVSKIENPTNHDAQKFSKWRYELRNERLEHQEDHDFYTTHREQLESADSRISQLPSVLENGAQDFAVALARELRRCYREDELEAPVREDRGSPCFHSDIEFALKKLEDNGNQFAQDWRFVRERSLGYTNLRDSRDKGTSPDFVSTARGRHGHLVIEAKLGRLFGHKAARDRYKGQQADYLSCPDCEGVILLAYDEPYTSGQMRQELCKELSGVLDMRAVAVGVVNNDEVEQPAPDDGDISINGDIDVDEDILDEDEEILKVGGVGDRIDHSAQKLEGLFDKDGNPDNRLLDLWRCLNAEQQKDGDCVLDKCFFDVPMYMLEIRNHLRDKTQWLTESVAIPEMLAGGSTQMGKTMFVVIGVCVAKKLEAASVVITHKISGRNSLANKIKQALQQLNKADRLGQLNPRCMAYAEKGKTEANRRDMLENNDCIVIADTASQIAEARGSMYRILTELQHDGVDKGRFIVFKDEADSMLRTDDRRLRLEESIDKLTPTTSSYHGSQLIINISATLMPVFLEMARTKAKPRGPVFLTSVPEGFRTKYSGVSQFSPLKSADAELHPDDDGNTLRDTTIGGDGGDGGSGSDGGHGDGGGGDGSSVVRSAPPVPDAFPARPVFLDPSLSRDPDSLGINKQVEAIFQDACRTDGARKKALLLDITLTRVYVAGSLFDKAEQMQAKYPSMHVVVYCGRGVVVRLAREFDVSSGNEIRVASKRSGTVLLPKWTPHIAAPMAGQKGGAWYTTAKNDWGTNVDGSNDGDKIIGPGQMIDANGRLARVDEVLNALEYALEQAGRGTDSIAVFGYTMMARGESFVTDERVPSHLVLFMTKGASFDLLVQTAGRATFMRLDLLTRNGWLDEQQQPVVRILMPKQDYNVIQSYPQLINLVDMHVRGGQPLDALFGDESVMKDIELLRDFADSHRHGFGDKRKQYPTSWMGGEEGSPDAESLDGALTRLQLPKRNEIIWFDYAREKTWYECKVLRVRFEDDAEEPFSADNVSYLLKCTDKSVDSLDEWLKLEPSDAAPCNWQRHKPGPGNNVHEAWVLQDAGKTRKAVQDLLREKLKEKQCRWMTAKGIEDLLQMKATSGESYGGLSGDELRHCLRDNGTLPSEVLQRLSERERPSKVERQLRQSRPSELSAKVRLRDGTLSGKIQDISLLPPAYGPDIELESGKSISAALFTNKKRVWPTHLIIVEQPWGHKLDESVSYETFVGTSHQSFDVSAATPEGLFEYRHIQPVVAPARRPILPHPSESSSQGSSSHDTPGRSRRGHQDDHEADGQPQSERLRKRARSGQSVGEPQVLEDHSPFMTKNDMRVIIDIRTKQPKPLVLHELLRSSGLVDATELNSLRAKIKDDNHDVPQELRRACIDRCDQKLRWDHLVKLSQEILVDWCMDLGIEYEAESSTPKAQKCLAKAALARKVKAEIISRRPGLPY